MAQYTAIFTKPYEDGYENLPSENTPITAETLNDKDDAIVNIETYLSGNDIPSDAEGLSYDNTDSGLTADNVQSAIDELTDTFANKEYNKDYLKSKNIWDEKWETGQYDTTTGQKINPTGVTTKIAVNPIKVNPNTTYFLHTNISVVRLFNYDANGTYINTEVVNNDTEFTTSSTTEYITFQCDVSMTYVCINVSDETVNGNYIPYVPSNIELDSQKADISAIGTDESGRTTASRSYTQGEHFYKDGKFGKTKTAVAQGATWTLNTNYEEITIADKIRDYATQVTPSSFTFASNKVKRTGNVVQVYLRFTTPLDTSSPTVIGSVPYKPSEADYVFLPIIHQNAPYQIVGNIFIRPWSNEIVIPQDAPTNTGVHVFGTYICE